jgi:hypothetical protein
LVPGGSVTFSLSLIGSAPTFQTVQFSPGIYIPAGNNYTLKFISTVGLAHWAGANYPMNYGSYMEITGSNTAGIYPAIHDWQIESGGNCDRLPVVAQIGNCLATPPPAPTCAKPANFSLVGITPNSATFSWTPVPNATLYRVLTKSGSFSFPPIHTTSTEFTITGLRANKKYKTAVKARCSLTYSAMSKSVTFLTPSLRLSNSSITEIHFFPNPAQGVLNFEGATEESEITLELYGLAGRQVGEKVISVQGGQFTGSLDISNFAPGIYIYKATGSGILKTGKIYKD